MAVDITGLTEDKLALVRGRKIGFVFQSYQLIPTLTAEENVLLPHELGGGDATAGLKRARELLDERRVCVTGWIIIRCSFPAANSNGWHWRAPSW